MFRRKSQPTQSTQSTQPVPETTSEIMQGGCGTCGQGIAWTVTRNAAGKVVYEGDKTCRWGHANQ